MDIITLKLVADKYIKLALEEDINSEDISDEISIKLNNLSSSICNKVLTRKEKEILIFFYFFINI